jgi:hypothetical protein
MAAYRAWANGFWWFATAVFTAIVFQSKTTSALAAAAEPKKKLTINTLKSLKVTGLPYIFFIVGPPGARVVRERHDCDFGLECP